MTDKTTVPDCSRPFPERSGMLRSTVPASRVGAQAPPYPERSSSTNRERSTKTNHPGTVTHPIRTLWTTAKPRRKTYAALRADWVDQT